MPTFRFLLALLFFPVTLLAESSDAIALYESGNVEAAASAYQKRFDAGDRSPELLYNLGNVAFKQNDLGMATLWYERAITAGSGHPESEQNLQLINKKTGRLVGSPSPLQGFLALPGTAFWLWSGTILLWIALLLLAVTFFYPKRNKLAGVLFSLLIGIMGATLLFAYNLRLKQAANAEVAIVTTSDTSVHTSPSPTSSSLVTAPSGSETFVLAERGSWTYIELPDDTRGWIPSESITPVSIPALSQ